MKVFLTAGSDNQTRLGNLLWFLEIDAQGVIDEYLLDPLQCAAVRSFLMVIFKRELFLHEKNERVFNAVETWKADQGTSTYPIEEEIQGVSLKHVLWNLQVGWAYRPVVTDLSEGLHGREFIHAVKGRKFDALDCRCAEFITRILAKDEMSPLDRNYLLGGEMMCVAKAILGNDHTVLLRLQRLVEFLGSCDADLLEGLVLSPDQLAAIHLFIKFLSQSQIATMIAAPLMGKAVSRWAALN